MKKQKILLSVIVFAFVLLVATIVNATDTFTTTDGIVVTKKVEGYKGDIDLNISNITLSSEGNYVWGISETSIKDDVSKWYALGDFSVSNKTAIINLVVSENSIRSILRKTNTAYLFIQNTKDESFIINSLELDLTLPPYHACGLYEWLRSYYITGGDSSSVEQWEGAPYGIDNAYYKFVKITDIELIKKYNQAIENETSLEDVLSISINDIENLIDWKSCTRDYTYPYTKIGEENLPTDDGLYILYIKAKDVDSKMLYGYKIWPTDGKRVSINEEDKQEENSSSEIDKKDDSKELSSSKGDTSSKTTGKTDTTIATYKTLPNTGISIALIGSILLILVGGIALLAKYHKYKDVK